REGPMVVVNIGGVSNITYIDGADTLIACDTGPGNALLDDYMIRTMGRPFDCEGRTASQGAVDVAWVVRALEHPFFALPPPKSPPAADAAGASFARHRRGRRRARLVRRRLRGAGFRLSRRARPEGPAA